MYTGSILGLTWSFIQPLAMILIFWFVFSKGFKSLPVANVPFVVWLFGGLIPWNFFSGGLAVNTSVFSEYGYLVKKTNFRLSILPVVKILSGLILHTIFLLILLLLLIIYRIPPSIYWLQIVYYTGALMFLLLGVSWITSSINVFLKDTAQIVAIIIQMGFWLSPIIWNSRTFAEEYQHLVMLNPLYYIIEGYRDSFIYHIPFWQHPGVTLYFWVVSIIIMLTGMLIYIRLRPHFADVI